MRQIRISIGGETKDVEIVKVTSEAKGVHIHCIVGGSRKLNIVKTVKGDWMQESDGALKPSLLAELIGRRMDQKDNTIVNDDTFLLQLTYNSHKYDLSVTPLNNVYRVVYNGDFLFDALPPDHTNDRWHSAPEVNADAAFVEAVGNAIQNY